MAHAYCRCRGTDWLLLFLLGLFFAPQAVAKKLHKHEDEPGGSQFAVSYATASGYAVGKQTEPPDPAQKVTVQQRGTKKEPLFYFVNHYHGPVEVEIELTRLDNLEADPVPPKRFVLPPASEQMAFSLRPKLPDQTGSYGFTYRSVIGDTRAEHDPAARYRPPLPPGQRFGISQGFNGGFTHNDAQNRYAVDFELPEGTPVHAARAGIVMEVIDHYTGHGLERKYASRANLVRLLHDDGTMGVYAHLQAHSARVSLGERAEEGQVIAASGNTGLSTGPHLHFAVQKNADMKLVSMPFTFKDAEGHAIDPSRAGPLSGF